MGFDFPTIIFGNRGVNPPSEAYLSEADQLIVCSQAVATNPITIAARVLHTNGQIQIYQYQHVLNGTRQPKFESFPLVEGFLLGLSVFVPTGVSTTVSRGIEFVSVWIGRGQGSTIVLLHPLVADYVVSPHPIGWPGSTLRHPTEGPGRLLNIHVTNQAGFNLQFVQPILCRWRFQGLNFTYTTSAVAGARIMAIRMFGQSGQRFWSRHAPGSQGASVSVLYSCVTGDQDLAVSTGETNVGAPNNIILALSDGIGATVSALAIAAGDAGDAFVGANLCVEEWIDT